MAISGSVPQSSLCTIQDICDKGSSGCDPERHCRTARTVFTCALTVPCLGPAMTPAIRRHIGSGPIRTLGPQAFGESVHQTMPGGANLTDTSEARMRGDAWCRAPHHAAPVGQTLWRRSLVTVRGCNSIAHSRGESPCSERFKGGEELIAKPIMAWR
jgi:hypothetical protein